MAINTTFIRDYIHLSKLIRKFAANYAHDTSTI